MDDILKSYVEDLRDNLLLFNESLMALENDEVDGEVINGVFRVAHTIKGNSAAMEFLKVEKVMHTMEDILFEVRDKTRELTPKVVDILYKCHDFLEDFLEVLLSDGDDKKMDTRKIMTKLNAIKRGNKTEKPIPKKQTKTKSKKTTNDLDIAFNALSEESIEVLKKNLEIGMYAKQIRLEFKQKVLMKAVRVFMLFQKLESHSTIVYSNPIMPSEDEFRSGEFIFDGDVLEAVVLCEEKIGYLLDEFKQDADIKNASMVEITVDALSAKLEELTITKVTDCIKSIEINVLAFQENDSNEEVVNKTICYLGELIKINHPSLTLLNVIALRLKEVLQYISIDSRVFTADIVKIITTIMEAMKMAVEAHEGEDIDAKTVKIAEENIIKLETIYFGVGEKTGEILERRGLLQQEEVEDIATLQTGEEELKFGQIAVKEGKVSAVKMADVLKEQNQNSKKLNVKSNTASSQIRVPVAKIDNLMDMLGELVILSSQLEEQVDNDENSDSTALNSISRMTKIVRNVQDLSMSLRLIKIKDTLFRLTRVIRDTANELEKKVNISLVGEDTELDRSAADKLFDPLMHLVRNAVSHGIELPADRIKAGKPEKGTIEVKAYSKRGHVYVEVNDDGKGIDPDKILQKAIERGLADPAVEYSESEIVSFVMQPGFSTQENINSISGRGVGMNVVESELAKIGGKVQIFNEFGKGCSFVMRIPMNLALINGTIVMIGEETYIIPTLFIQQFYIQKEEDWLSMQGKKRAINIRNKIIPLIMPEEVLGIESNEEVVRDKIVVLDMDNRLIALPVDEIVGRREIVSKPLDQEMAGCGVLTGASILGDGKVSLILDIEAMFKMVKV